MAGITLFFLVILTVVVTAEPNYFLRQHECNSNERYNKAIVYSNGTIDFECSRILCGGTELKLDDEKNCTDVEQTRVQDFRPKCVTTKLITNEYVGVQLLKPGHFYTGGIEPGKNSENSPEFDYIESFKLMDEGVYIRVYRLKCKNSSVRGLSHKVEEIMVQNIEQKPVYDVRSMWKWFKEHFFHLRPSEEIIFVHGQNMKTELISIRTDAATVTDLKKLLKNLTKCNTDQQKLYFEGRLLEDESKLSDYNIGADSVVRLELYEKVHFMNKTGKITPILFRRGFTFDDLQASVEREFNVPVKTQLLLYEGKKLTVDRIQEIETGSIVFVDEKTLGKIYLIYRSNFLVVELDENDECSVDDLYSKAKQHFGIYNVFETKIYLDGTLLTAGNKGPTKMHMKNGSFLKVTTSVSHYSHYLSNVEDSNEGTLG